ncbi:MAG: hypothetical protein EXS05_16715 [Planctomycetaceae bacterium]|nr:hypothetical protein [Planctomycetaceae bacterium]
MTVLEQQPLTLAVPLREDPPGVLRVGESRVLLELVIMAHRQGASPEDIVLMYDSLLLKDVFAVIAWCLTNPSAVDEYLRQCDEQAATIRRQIEAAQSPGPTKEVLQARALANRLPS